MNNLAKHPLGPDESHSVHQMRATTVIFEEDSGSPIEVMQRIIYPNQPHASALHVEEIDTITFTSPEQKRHYQSQLLSSEASVATHTVIEEIESDNDSKAGKLSRGVSITSASEDEMLSRQNSRTAVEGELAKPTNATVGESDIKQENASQEQFETNHSKPQVVDVTDSPRKGNLLDPAEAEEHRVKKTVEKKVSFEDDLPQQGKCLERQEAVTNEPEQPAPVQEEVIEKKSVNKRALAKEPILDGSVDESSQKAVTKEPQESSRPEGTNTTSAQTGYVIATYSPTNSMLPLMPVSYA